MPSRALTFLHEVRDAIHNAERVVVVLGPHALGSDYVRAEWQHALAEAKVVVPILRLGTYLDLPAELGSLHCPNCTAARPEMESFAEIERILTDPVPPLGLIRGELPDLPAHFQPRPSDITAIAHEVFRDLESPDTMTGPERIVLIHGMGGVGKSVLAAVFGRSTSTRRTFPDGVVWLAANPETRPLDLLRRFGQLITGSAQSYANEETATTELRQLLAGRRTLLVIDNVWHVEQLEHLLGSLDVSARILATARDAGLATGLGARAVEIGELSEEAALQQLADWVHQTVDRLPPAASELARQCGYLPLALALNGAMLADKVDWQDLIAALRSAELDYAEKRLGQYPHPTVLRSIKVSIDALQTGNPEALARYRALVAFDLQFGVPEAAVAMLWDHLHADSDRATRKILSVLMSKALLRMMGESPNRTIFLHDLLIDYLLATVDGERDMNGELLEAYRRKCPSGWPTGPNDGYFFEHLAHHLSAAGRTDELCDLLTRSPQWMEAKCANCHGDSATVTDLDLAMATLPNDRTLERIKLHAVRRLVDRRAELYSDMDLQTLVHLGREPEAMSHARLRATAAERIAGLMAIFRAPSRRAERRLALLDEALQMVADADLRAHYAAWRGLASLVEALTREDRLSEAQAVTERTGQKGDHAHDPSNLIVFELETCRERLDLRCTAVTDQTEYGNAGPDIWPGTEQALTQEFEGAMTLANGEHGALMNLACRMVRYGKTDCAIRAARAIRDTRPTYDTDSVLRSAAAEAARKRLPAAARAVVDAIGDPGVRRSALGECAALLSLSFPAQARQFFEEALADDSWRLEYIIDSIGRAKACWTPEFIERVFAVLAARPRVKAHAGSIGEKNIDVNLLLIGLVRLHWTPLIRALVRLVKTHRLQAGNLVEHAERALNIGFTDAALTIADEVSDKTARSRLMAMTALAMVETDIQQAIDVARRADGQAQLHALEAMALGMARAGDPRATKVFDENVNAKLAAANITAPDAARHGVASALVRLNYPDAGLKALEMISDEGERTRAIGQLAPSLIKAGRMTQLVEAARALERPLRRGQALLRLAEMIDDENFLSEATAAANTEAHPRGRECADWISALCEAGSRCAASNPQRARTLFAEASTAARKVATEVSVPGQVGEGDNALAFVSASLAQVGWFSEAMEVVRAIGPDNPRRPDAMGDIAELLARSGDPKQARELASEADGIAAKATWDAISMAMSGVPPVGYDTQQRERVERAIAARMASDVPERAVPEATIHTGSADISFDPNTALNVTGLENFLTALALSAPALERQIPPLGLAALREATRIAGWFDPSWASMSTDIARLPNRAVPQTVRD